MLHKEGKPSLWITGLLAALTGVLFLYNPSWWMLIPFLVSAMLFGFMINFFRNPNRPLPRISEDIIYAPADGKIVVIEEVEDNEFRSGKYMQVSIFMSPLNVHVNRNPVTGDVLYSKYHEGKYLAAWNPKASTENERTTIVYQFKHGELKMRQIAGALARRIVNYLNAGDAVHQGVDMGFIKLGSRVDLFLPLEAHIEVTIDQMVFGNQTVIATFK